MVESSTTSIWSIPLVRHLSVMLLLKLSLLIALWWLFIRQPALDVKQGFDASQHISGVTETPVVVSD